MSKPAIGETEEKPGIVRTHLVVRGRVQGVGFRISCARWAEAAGVSGFVRNLADGGVEVEIEGAPVQVAEVEAWCRQGPRMAHVSSVDSARIEPTMSKTFSIR